MKILYCHNIYQQAGGEDNCADDEIKLLREHGHEVVRFTKHNDSIQTMSKLAVAAKTIWSTQSSREVSDLLKKHQIDVLHAMNTFPLISPSVYYAARRQGVAVVQSLQNYRLLCPGAYLMRDGKLCTECVSKTIPWPAIKHKCYRGSRAGSAIVTSMLVTHRLLGTWKKLVNRYCACTEHGKQVFVSGGLPADRIAVKPNFIDPIPAIGTGQGGYALFAGRLSPEKGVAELLSAWQQMPNAPTLKIVGDGPLRPDADSAAQNLGNVESYGWKSPAEVAQLMGNAACLILPSLWYEGFPKTQVESLALGTPVLAANLGSMSESIHPWINGLHFEPGSADAIKNCVTEFFANPQRWPALRKSTRQDFLEKYTGQKNYETLIDIYQQAIADTKR